MRRREADRGTDILSLLDEEREEGGNEQHTPGRTSSASGVCNTCLHPASVINFVLQPSSFIPSMCLVGTGALVQVLYCLVHASSLLAVSPSPSSQATRGAGIFVLYCITLAMFVAASIHLPIVVVRTYLRLSSRSLLILYVVCLVVESCFTSALVVDVSLYETMGVHVYDTLIRGVFRNPAAFFPSMGHHSSQLVLFYGLLLLGLLLVLHTAVFYVSQVILLVWINSIKQRRPHGGRLPVPSPQSIHVVLSVIVVLGTWTTLQVLGHVGSSNHGVLLFLPVLEMGTTRTAAARAADDGHVKKLRMRLPGDPPRLLRHPDIIIVQLDSLRVDMLSDRTVPNLWRWLHTGDGVTSAYHLSTGQFTETSSFGLLYGLDPDMRIILPTEKSGDRGFALHTLKENGYDLHLIGSDLTYWFSMGRYAPFMVEQFDTVKTVTALGWEQDEQIVSEAIRLLEERRTQPPETQHPLFLFVVLSCTHYPYFFHPQHKIVKSTIHVQEEGAEAILKGLNPRSKRDRRTIRRFVNNYINSIHFSDHSFARVAAVASEDAVICVLGDHGEELWDQGRFGHFGLHDDIFFNFRIQVPLKIRLPGVPFRVVPFSSHADFWPTVFDYIGVEYDDPVLFSAMFTGHSLLQANVTNDRYTVTVDAGFPFWGERLLLCDGEFKYWLHRRDCAEHEYCLTPYRVTTLEDTIIPTLAEVDPFFLEPIEPTEDEDRMRRRIQEVIEQYYEDRETRFFSKWRDVSTEDERRGFNHRFWVTLNQMFAGEEKPTRPTLEHEMVLDGDLISPEEEE